jgi:peptide deformylase
MALEIVKYPNRVLRRRAVPVKEIDERIRQLADDMVEALVFARGYGLAAPQVGASARLIIVDVDDELHILVNPEIVETSEEQFVGPEGCLSIPGVEAEVERALHVTVRALDLSGQEVQIEAEELLARVLQHEIDHLNGVLFIDYLSHAKRQSLLKEYQRKLKEEKEEEPAKPRPRERVPAVL